MAKNYRQDYPDCNVAGRRGRRVTLTLTECAYDHVSKGRWVEMVELNVCFRVYTPIVATEVHHIWEVEKADLERVAMAANKPFGEYTGRTRIADALVENFPLEYTDNAKEFLTPKGFESAKRALHRALCDYAVRHGLCDTASSWTGQF